MDRKKKHKRSGGIRQHPVTWMNGDGNGLVHPATGQRLQGENWGPVTGCTEELPCWVRCWARKTATTRLAHLGPHYQHFTPHFHQDRLGEPLHWCKPRAVWTAGMGDMFHEQITDEQIAKVLGVAGLCTNHLFIILTKRAKRAFEWSQWAMKSDYEPVIFEHDTRQVKSITSGLLPLPNVWLLASVSNQFEANERIPWLLRVPAALHGLSIEPLLGEIYLDSILVSDADPNRDDSIEARLNALTGHVAGLDNILPNRLRFIAVGGENGPNARPCDPAWIRSLRDQCVDARVAFYFKGWGKHIPDVVEHCMSEEQRQKVCAGGYIRPEAEDMPRRSFERMLDGRTWEDVPR